MVVESKCRSKLCVYIWIIYKYPGMAGEQELPFTIFMKESKQHFLLINLETLQTIYLLAEMFKKNKTELQYLHSDTFKMLLTHQLFSNLGSTL